MIIFLTLSRIINAVNEDVLDSQGDWQGMQMGALLAFGEMSVGYVGVSNGNFQSVDYGLLTARQLLCKM